MMFPLVHWIVVVFCYGYCDGCLFPCPQTSKFKKPGSLNPSVSLMIMLTLFYGVVSDVYQIECDKQTFEQDVKGNFLYSYQTWSSMHVMVFRMQKSIVFTYFAINHFLSVLFYNVSPRCCLLILLWMSQNLLLSST